MFPEYILKSIYDAIAKSIDEEIFTELESQLIYQKDELVEYFPGNFLGEKYLAYIVDIKNNEYILNIGNKNYVFTEKDHLNPVKGVLLDSYGRFHSGKL